MKGRIVYGADSTRYYIGSREVTEEEFRLAFPPKPLTGGTFGGHLPSCWPMKPSEALAVHPNQRQEAIDQAKDKGVPTDFDRIGRPIFRDRGHRRAYLKAYGFHDQRGGYGDG